MPDAWARSVAAGIEDRVFWGSTPWEVNLLGVELMRVQGAHERAANRRAGLVAAQIVNMAGRQSRRTVDADHFFRYDDDHDDTPEALRNALIGLALRTGARIA